MSTELVLVDGHRRKEKRHRRGGEDEVGDRIGDGARRAWSQRQVEDSAGAPLRRLQEIGVVGDEVVAAVGQRGDADRPDLPGRDQTVPLDVAGDSALERIAVEDRFALVPERERFAEKRLRIDVVVRLNLLPQVFQSGHGLGKRGILRQHGDVERADADAGEEIEIELLLREVLQHSDFELAFGAAAAENQRVPGHASPPGGVRYHKVATTTAVAVRSGVHKFASGTP